MFENQDYDLISVSQGHKVIVGLDISFGDDNMYNFTLIWTVNLS